MYKSDQVILLNTNSQLTIKVVDNRNGVLVQLVTASDAKTVDATLMWTPYGEDRVTFINRKQVLEYRCMECQAEFEDQTNYCPECGADEVMYNPDLKEEAT